MTICLLFSKTKTIKTNKLLAVCFRFPCFRYWFPKSTTAYSAILYKCLTGPQLWGGGGSGWQSPPGSNIASMKFSEVLFILYLVYFCLQRLVCPPPLKYFAPPYGIFSSLRCWCLYVIFVTHLLYCITVPPQNKLESIYF